MKMSSTFTTLGASNHSKEERQKNDFYATNPKDVELFLDTLHRDNVKLSRKIWECACGDGSISKVLINYGYEVFSTDLIDRGYPKKKNPSIDFLSTEKVFDGDIFTNPPFKHAQEFVLHGLNRIKSGRKIIMILRIQFLESVGRHISIFKKYPPKYVYIYSKRITMHKDNLKQDTDTSGAMCFAWFVWHKDDYTETILRWLSADIYQYKLF